MVALRTLRGTWDELLDCPTATPRPAAAELVAHLHALGAGRAAGPPGPGRRRHPHHGHHVHRLLRRPGHRPGLAVRHHPPRHRRRRVARASRPGSIQRLRGPQPVHRRPLQRPADHRRRRVPGRAARPTRRTSGPSAGACTRAFGVWAHICGSDLVRDADGTMYVLEDNLRVPSGVSYVLENRLISKRAFADLFERQSILPGRRLHRRAVRSCWRRSPRDGVDEPARRRAHAGHLQLGLLRALASSPSGWASTLVEGRDLVVGDDDCVYMRTIDGLERVDVIYRRIDDLFLDPEVFRPDSMLGVPGLMRAWRGRQRGASPTRRAPASPTTRSSTPGCPTSSATTSARSRSSPTCRPTAACTPTSGAYVIDNIGDLVVKPANESGGYGILIGNRATARASSTRDRRRIEADPRNWVAQPILDAVDGADARATAASSPATSTCARSSSPGATSYVTAGGLTRVALPRGLARRQLLAGRRQQGHLDRRPLACRTSTAASGRGSRPDAAVAGRREPLLGGAATSSGPRTPPASCASTRTCIVDLPDVGAGRPGSRCSRSSASRDEFDARHERGRRGARSCGSSSPTASNSGSILMQRRAGAREPAHVP